MNLEESVRQAILQTAINCNISEFNKNNIAKLEANDKKIEIIILLSNKHNHLKQQFYEYCINAIKKNFNIDATIMIVLDKKEEISNSKKISKHANILGVKHVIAIMSGKGGVGKSTISAYLALNLKQLGLKVALVDADIYGPSIPVIFNTQDIKPVLKDNKFIPIESFGIHTISIGNIIDKNAAAIWRGPMATKALYQLIGAVQWIDVDIMIVDLPPGTGDIYMSLFENFQIDGAILITTPQKIALNDVVKSVDMLGKLNIPIVGVIENMSYYIINGEERTIFGEGGGQKLADYAKTTLMKSIPLDENISNNCDEGNVYLHDFMSKHFREISNEICKWLKII